MSDPRTQQTSSSAGRTEATPPWQVLVVDDEPDVHQITKLALRHKKWKGRTFAITSAASATEARAVLERHARDHFHVALVDVVMESDTAGLELCEYIRKGCPASLRIILRTGHSQTPEERVLNEYDVDYYLAKPEATPEKLFTLLRASLRSGQDISTLLAFATQLQNFTRALKNVSALPDLLVFMEEGLAFLELKHSVSTVFWHDLDTDERIHIGAGHAPEKLSAIREKLLQCHERKLRMNEFYAGAQHGLEASSFIIPFECSLDATPQHAAVRSRRGGLFALGPANFSQRSASDFYADASLFIENWKIAYSALQLQEQLARETLLRERMYFERLEGIATMVTGVAHEMNTPLGVANTANSMIAELVERVLGDEPLSNDDRATAKEDLAEASKLLTKNLKRAHDLIRSFKQLSSSQMIGDRLVCSLADVVKDCVVTMQPELRKKRITVTVDDKLGPDAPTWNGFPGHLTQVIVNFLQNTGKHGYDDNGGSVEITLSGAGQGDSFEFQITYVDHGKGIKAEILPRIFEPFVTTARGSGGTGLGLAISHNIVTNLLGGRINVESTVGKGTTFSIALPVVAPENKTIEPGHAARG